MLLRTQLAEAVDRGGAAGVEADGDDQEVHTIVHDRKSDHGFEQVMLGHNAVEAKRDQEE